MKFFVVLGLVALAGSAFAEEHQRKAMQPAPKSAYASALYQAMNSKPNYNGPYGSFQLGYGLRPLPYAMGYGSNPTYGSLLNSFYGKPSNNVYDLGLAQPASYGALAAYGNALNLGSYGSSGGCSGHSSYGAPAAYAAPSYAAPAYGGAAYGAQYGGASYAGGYRSDEGNQPKSVADE